LSYLKANLGDLANHYHALYQEEELAEEQPANYAEAQYWYKAYLESFPEDPETPGINYQLADLLMEHEDFGTAALEYERTAYGYAPHEQAGAAGYAAIYAHREHEKIATGADQLRVRQAAVESTVRFVDAFPLHEHAAVVLRAAVEDMYDMQEFERAVATGHRLIDDYPEADQDIQRSAWTVIAHASFDLADYQPAEAAYLSVLAMTPEDDEERPALVDNLAAAIYKQGEEANVLEDYQAAADHFLRIRRLITS
jgi:tetratricopeptide (TPR) repeat protein